MHYSPDEIDRERRTGFFKGVLVVMVLYLLWNMAIAVGEMEQEQREAQLLLSEEQL